jgi:hypothetical protein
MTTSVWTWWTLLCAVSLINVVAWTASATHLWRRSLSFDPKSWSAIRVQIILSAGYVFGCAYRSVLPVFDIERLCLIDSWLSSVIVGRSVATIAELCFVTQWAMLSRGIAQTNENRVGVMVSHAVVPMILVAELFSWYAVLTTSNLGHVIEESLWGLCALMLAASYLHALPRSQREHRSLLATFSAIGALYALYMFLVDVPMYWSRWIADSEQGHQFLSVAQGFLDVSGRWVVSHQWADWESEVIWMSAYFSIAVWMSISLIHVPHLKTLTSKPSTAGNVTRLTQ